MGLFDFWKHKKKKKKEKKAKVSTPIGTPKASPTANSPIIPPTPVTSVTSKKKKKQSQGFLWGGLKNLLGQKNNVDEELLEELEELLVATDMGLETASSLLQKVKKQAKAALDLPQALDILRKEMLKLLSTVPAFPDPRKIAPESSSSQPHIILIVGVNGAGKTTTVGKLATFWKKQHKKVLIGAADTFRAAAIEQLQTWGKKINVPVVSHGMHKDPGSVAFDTVKQAIAQQQEIVLIDTAGRLHNKKGLMEELVKIKRVINKQMNSAPHEIVLILDGSTGQNAWQQVRIFHEKLQLTSIIVTKIDGLAKGGAVLGISHQLRLPIQYIGVGEKAADLQLFSPENFVDQLLAPPTT